MKLFIINGENNNEKIEIHINESMMVKDIKYKLDEVLHGNANLTKYYFRLIYKSIILFYNNSIKYYKICENDEMWFGKIDNYLRKDDVIVYVFIWGRIYGRLYLIVQRNDIISTIISIIERIYSEVINIWNADGKQMKNDQTITEINTNENYKLIIKCDDGEGNEIDNTFDECCYLHDKQRVDRYLFLDKIRDDNKNESTRTILINLIDQIKQIISSNDTIDDRLNQNLSDLSSSFLNSTDLFCLDMTNRILNICYDYLRFVENQYENDVTRIFYQYFQFAIRAALWDFSNIRQQQNNNKTNKSVSDIIIDALDYFVKIFHQYFQFAIRAALWDFSNIRQQENNNRTNKSVSDIIIDALDYFVKYLIDFNNDWRYWLRLFMNRYLLTSFSDSDLNERINECAINKFTIKLKMNGENRNNFIPSKPETIIEAKQSISRVYKVNTKHLYCIKPGGDYKLNDEDKFDDEFIIEIVLSMEDIEVLRSLGRGGFGATYLCRSKISNKQFVMKKPIRNDGDLYRDINIYSKLHSSRNIMNYSGLFRYGENICIGMEYLSGGSLRSYLDKGKHLSEQEIVKISYEILTQINELHKLGIIHRDIKSDNIVLDEHNHAKLIDFGISKCTIELTSKDLLDKLEVYKPGTIRYMAPELIKGEPYSEKIDIWSFGMVMVEMVTGKRPFHWLKPFQAVRKIRDCTKYEFEPIFPISNELNQFINSCLNTNPNERPSAEQLIKSELFIDYLNKF